MAFWPWDVAEEVAKYTADAAIGAAVALLVGLGILIIGLLIMARKLPTPLGPVGDWVVGGIVAILGVMVALGVLT